MECTICYNKIEEGAGYNKWKCTHSFHKKCIIDWDKSCPVCRCEGKNYENIETYGEMAILRGHTGTVTCLTLHENKLFSGGDDMTIRVWAGTNIETYETIATLRGHTGSVWCLTLHENKLYSGSLDKNIRIWNPETYETIATLRGGGRVFCLTHLKNKLFSGGSDNSIRVWNTETHEQIATLRGHTDTVRCLTLSGNNLISASSDTTIRIWNGAFALQDLKDSGYSLQDFKELKDAGFALRNHYETIATLEGHTDYVRCLTIHENKLYSGGDDETIRIWNTENSTGMYFRIHLPYEHITTLEGHTDSVTCLTLHENKLYSGSVDNTIRVWNTETHEQIATLRGHSDNVFCLTVHENKLFSGSDDNTIRIWKI